MTVSSPDSHTSGWLKEKAQRIEGTFGSEMISGIEREQLDAYMKMFQVSSEERDQVLRPLAESGNEAVGSMGDDTPMAVLSRRERSLYDYFRQKFAQVTNPPIDPCGKLLSCPWRQIWAVRKTCSTKDQSMPTGSS